MDDDNFEVIDVENYKGGGDQKFSYQTLVMKAVSKCIDTGTKEMRQGYYNERTDKNGNKIMVYVPDTRKDFIESVETLRMLLIRDYDYDVENKVKEIEDKLAKEYNKLCECEEKEWSNLTFIIKKKRWSNGVFETPNSLNTKLPYYQEYIEYQIKCYREIFAELLKLVKRLNDYEELAYANAI